MKLALWFQVVASSYALDFVARQKIGGTHLTYGFLKQLPFPRLRPASSSGCWIPRGCFSGQTQARTSALVCELI